MKTSAKIFNITQAVLLSVTLSFAGNKNKSVSDSVRPVVHFEKCLAVRINPTERDMPLEGTTVRVFLENDTIAVINTDLVALKKVSLNRNRHYAIEVSKKGYYSKMVSISTMLPSDLEDEGFVYEYDLQIDLIKEKAGIDTYYMDFPVALISYNEKTDLFSYSHKYTEGIKKEIRQELGAGFAGNFQTRNGR